MKRPTENQVSMFNTVQRELEQKGTLSAAIEYGADGEWLGMVYEKDMSFTDPREQDHFAKCVLNGEERL